MAATLDDLIAAIDQISGLLIQDIDAGIADIVSFASAVERDFDRVLNLLAVIGNTVLKSPTGSSRGPASTTTPKPPEIEKPDAAHYLDWVQPLFEKLAGVFTNAVTAGSQFVSTIEGVGIVFTAGANHLASYVAAANPAAILQFNLALRDTVATLGNILTPVLQTATDIIRGFGSAVASLGPNAKLMIQALAGGALALGVFTAATAAFEAIATGGIGPLIAVVLGAAGAMGVLQDGVGGLRDVFADVGDFLSSLADTLMPSFQAVMAAIKPLMLLVMGAVGSLAGSLAQGMMPIIAMLASGFGEMVTAAGPLVQALTEIGQALIGQIVANFTALASILTPIGLMIVQVGGTLLKSLVEPFTKVMQVFAGITQWVGDLLTKGPLLKALTFTLIVFSDTVKNVADIIATLANAFVKFSNFLIEIYNSLARTMGWALLANIKLAEFEKFVQPEKRERKPADIGVRDVGTTSLEAITQTTLVDSLRSSFGRKDPLDDIKENTGLTAAELQKINAKGREPGPAPPPIQDGVLLRPGDGPMPVPAQPWNRLPANRRPSARPDFDHPVHR